MDSNGPTDQKHGHSQPRRVVVVRGDGALRSGARILPMFVAAFSRTNFQVFLRGAVIIRGMARGLNSKLKLHAMFDGYSQDLFGAGPGARKPSSSGLIELSNSSGNQMLEG